MNSTFTWLFFTLYNRIWRRSFSSRRWRQWGGLAAVFGFGATSAGCTSGAPPLLPPAPNSAQVLVRPYPTAFGYGTNLGYYGAAWPDERLAAAAAAAGSTTIRVTLPEEFLVKWGPNARRAAFSYYADSLGLRDLVCFVGEPTPAHRDPATYPGCHEQSRLFANLYEPIWQANGRVNPKNYYAQYIYDLTQRYGNNIRVWEVVNEPDFITNTVNEKWAGRAPAPAELPNLQAPVYRYIRTLRITWEVVKKYRPAAYVTPGGLGYAQFLDALLRYTDNPHDGRPTPHYPALGGAYFDLVDYHVYPSYYLRHRAWQRAGRFAYTRHSDGAAAQVLGHQAALAAVLRRYGYDGTTYPRKHFIVTETNIARRPSDWRFSSDEMQRNFGIKALVLAQVHDIRQLHFYSLAEAATAPPPGTAVSSEEEFKLMGLYEDFNRDAPGRQRLTQLGQAMRTTSSLLRGLPYNAAGTAALHLPPTVAGAAFGGASRLVYVLWAKTLTDQQENATATYTLPPLVGPGHLTQHAWNQAPGTPGQALPPSQPLALTGTPAFFVFDRPAPVAGLR
ncbi:hypothetical protein GO988_11680 [Hymenobacter sp. HMF4947]|uniref:Glycoside hydrolase family 5 domain-containing protein n=1 Tax=Hymenobacter ginkgonis TaxID=2682976 RepID=A0A7K1TEZ6_9BACT|nr:hypothetical protein [Hymenobacter ginkgonis]MVN76986.1 hypothetical protein [Hymenobacter ginkgonis]